MEPSGFEGANAVLGPPEGVSEREVASLIGYHGPVYDWPGCSTVVCWKPTRAELDEIARTGRVWVAVRGVVSPHYVSGFRPEMGPRR